MYVCIANKKKQVYTILFSGNMSTYTSYMHEFNTVYICKYEHIILYIFVDTRSKYMYIGYVY